MKTLEFTISIEATREKVWKVLWDDATYRDWASVFCEGTYAVSNWNQGDSIQFLTPDGSGMNSVIFKKVDCEYMAFKHLSDIKEFKVLPVEENIEGWSEAMETYSLSSNGTGTLLVGTMDLVEEYIDYFETTFPKALARIKEISENNI
ncbi:SRPBCC domain-containing protein [Flavobacterium adhaerens]|uniref:SRPBCC domain-containing protein n=1 Tax=Flavobacterium adhaerens TaxID=3149043 RepID=UPI0032B59BBA